LFHNPRIALIAGDVGSAEDLQAALSHTDLVINASSAELGQSWAECEERVRSFVSTFGEACMAAGIKRVIHLGSTASLFLGAAGVRVDGSTLPDRHPEQRALYSRAKGLADELLLAQGRERSLPVCVMRPAIVVGKWGTPFHSGVGLFVNGRHFIGWNEGNNPLPFVLASDVAAAAISAVSKPGLEGRCYNLAGDVRLTAREYVAELAAALERPIAYHPQSTEWLWLTESGKWAIKAAAGQRAWRPTLRDLRSRAFLSEVNSDDAKWDLEWKPEANRDAFIEAAIKVHASRRQVRS
jgi:nucleoside-diphosphate-sugar epimerase